jgi:signal transduction histidine kinase/CheY-like chemotaxis protein/HPt (histidine-containing phosphotransfer) domain-containing protein
MNVNESPAAPLWLKWLASVLPACAIGLAWWWLPMIPAAILSAPLVGVIALWWLRPQPGLSASLERHAVSREPATPHTRMAALEAELASLRGVQRELIAAKQAAESAMLAKSEFLATMSHEIRTPLNGILPLLDIVLGMPLQPTPRDYLVTAHKSAQELLRIVDDILDYSKVEAGKLELEKVGFNLRELMFNVQRLLDKPAEAKGLALRIVVDDDVRASVRGDPVRLRQILTNLVGNAIKFTEKGGVSVRISRRADTATHHELLFAVRDTGIGLAPDAAARLFHPFTQADASVTRRYGGTGLGLTICKKLVELMNGKIGVRSEPGRGSVFWFSVPFEKMPGDIAGARHDLGGLRTLLACGTRESQKILPMLAGLGLEVTHVAAAAAALVRLRQVAPLGRAFAYELLIMDASSLDGDANALLRNVLRDPKLAAIRVLALGGAAETDPRIASMTRDVTDSGLRNALQTLYGMPDRGRPQPLLGAPLTPEAATAAERQLHGLVLLVEDHPVNQQVARRLLERLGLKVELAGNGAEALEKIKQQHFNLVLMDCQMPVLDGYSATRRLRERELAASVPRLPVIAMTAHAMAGDRERCLEAGMDDYLTKPLDRTLLAETLARWLDLAGTPPAPPERIAVMPEALAPVQAPPAVAPSPVSSAGAATKFASAPAPGFASAPVAAMTPDVLDAATLADLEEIMGEELRGLVTAYLTDGDARLKALREAAERNDVAEVGKLAHSLKSASANLGAQPLATEAKGVEHDARSRALSDPPARVAVLERLYAETSRALRERFRI